MRVPHQQPHTEMIDTWAFYERRAAQYAEATLSQSMERWLSPFMARLPAGAPVVDLGCGAGRDLKFLRVAGFAAIGLDRSEPLARIAGRHSNAPVVVGGFGARISAWRHFKGCRADIFRGYHGGLSCRSSLIPRAVITFLVSGIG